MKKKSFCSFYVSEYHLLTILVPYINEQLSNFKNVEVILENDMIEYVKKFLKRNEMFNVSKIVRLNWKKTKDEDIKLKENTDIVVVCGNERFIENVNEKLERNEFSKEIINCFNIESLNDLENVVKGHDFVLKTSGLCEIKKSSHNEQKRKTIQTQI